jgi:hypothetical protein
LNFKYKNLFAWLIGAAFFLIIVTACSPPSTERVSRLVMFVGVDVSGSFQKSGYYEDALTFLSHYIYGHLNGLGEMAGLRALFVGSIGGHSTNEPKAFHPIHDLEGKSIREIRASLLEWFPPRDTITDFNAFFAEIAAQTKDRNLTLAPICIMIITDGVPATGIREDKSTYEHIDLDPLEYLSRRVTVRLTYLDPIVAKRWRDNVPARRVRIWTVPGEIMEGWKEQMQPGVELAKQDKFWRWVKDNVDFRVRRRKF